MNWPFSNSNSKEDETIILTKEQMLDEIERTRKMLQTTDELIAENLRLAQVNTKSKK